MTTYARQGAPMDPEDTIADLQVLAGLELSADGWELVTSRLESAATARAAGDAKAIVNAIADINKFRRGVDVRGLSPDIEPVGPPTPPAREIINRLIHEIGDRPEPGRSRN